MLNKVQGAALKAKREKDGYSAKELADKLHTVRENIYKWELGVVPRKKVFQKRLKDYLNGVPVKVPKPKVSSSTNGTVPHEDFKQKYYTLLEKHNALLETLLEKK